MADAAGETDKPLRVAFDRRIKSSSTVPRSLLTGLLDYRELDDAFGLTAMGASALSEGRRGRNIGLIIITVILNKEGGRDMLSVPHGVAELWFQNDGKTVDLRTPKA